MPDMKMNYEDVEAMIAAFRRSAERLESIAANLQQAVSTLQGGALLGSEGDRLVGALAQRLTPKVNNGRDKFVEMCRDLNAAIEDMQNADSSSGRLFY